MTRIPRFAYVIAVLLGIVAASAPANLPLESPSFAAALMISTGIFAVVGLLLGLLWPGNGWKWGFWVVAPGFMVVTIGVITSGEGARFLNDDLPFLAAGLVGACMGAGVAARARLGRSSLPTNI